jgi:hypothetical protein
LEASLLRLFLKSQFIKVKHCARTACCEFLNTHPLVKVFFGQIVPNLTTGGSRVFFLPLQLKSGLLPEAGCGGTKILEMIRARGEQSQATDSQVTFKTEPVS